MNENKTFMEQEFIKCYMTLTEVSRGLTVNWYNIDKPDEAVRTYKNLFDNILDVISILDLEKHKKADTTRKQIISEVQLHKKEVKENFTVTDDAMIVRGQQLKLIELDKKKYDTLLRYIGEMGYKSGWIE